MVSCSKKNEVAPDNTIISKTELITQTWKLTGLVNISDEQKYLNSILIFKSNNHYIFIDNSGDTIATGNWMFTQNSDSVSLDNYGIWCNQFLYTYKILNLNQSEFQLMEHYTLDDKDEYLEYYFTLN
jgi:hypothetical protein